MSNNPIVTCKFHIVRYGREAGFKVNATKTKITTPNNLRYLGFEFWFSNSTYKARPYKDCKERLARKINQLCKKNLGIDLDTRITKLNQVARSWVNYFKIGDMKNFPLELSAHIRTMLRIIIWKQWKVPGKRQWGLQKLAINKDLARQTSYMRNRYYFVATKTCVRDAISLAKLKKKGLVDIYEYYEQ